LTGMQRGTVIPTLSWRFEPEVAEGLREALTLTGNAGGAIKVRDPGGVDDEI